MRELIDGLALQGHIPGQVTDSVVAIDLSGIILSWNRGAARLHGYSAEEAIGRHNSHISLVYEPEEHAMPSLSWLGRLLERDFLECDALARTKSCCARALDSGSAELST